MANVAQEVSCKNKKAKYKMTIAEKNKKNKNKERK